MSTTADSQSLAGTLLVEHQRLATSGARAVLPFHTDSELCLAIPQLAIDIPGTPPHMNGGDSNVDMPLYRWSGATWFPQNWDGAGYLCWRLFPRCWLRLPWQRSL